jgi:hypothetical protein
MKLIAHEEGRSLQLISADEIRPLRGGVFAIEALSKIVSKYRFTKYPNVYEPNTTIKLEIGVAQVDALTIPILALEIYADGLLMSTRNTEDSDIVLDEFMKWSIVEFGFRAPTTSVPRKYVSRVVVDITGEFDNLSRPFRTLGTLASNAFGVESENLSIINLSIGSFPPTQYPYQTTWQLTRRMSDPHVRERYLSSAPLSSPEHLLFLENVEKTLRRT